MVNKFSIKVPGTSANLGPGFDLMGLALDIYNIFEFSFESEATYDLRLFSGETLPFSNSDNLIKNAYLIYESCFLKNNKLPPFNVKININLPIRGGLGSSASAIVAGYLAANVVHKSLFSSIPQPSENVFLLELAKIEGHPDNTIPAYLGGLVFSFISSNQIIFFKKKFPSSVKMILFIPEMETDTIDSRKKLPEKYPIGDIVYNMSRIGTWFEFLNSEKIEHLSIAIEDKLHTPYRIKSTPYLNELVEYLRSEKILYTLSGSGPSLLIFVDREDSRNIIELISNFINLKLKKYNIKYKLIDTVPCDSGTEINNFHK